MGPLLTAIPGGGPVLTRRQQPPGEQDLPPPARVGLGASNMNSREKWWNIYIKMPETLFVVPALLKWRILFPATYFIIRRSHRCAAVEWVSSTLICFYWYYLNFGVLMKSSWPDGCSSLSDSSIVISTPNCFVLFRAAFPGQLTEPGM